MKIGTNASMRDRNIATALVALGVLFVMGMVALLVHNATETAVRGEMAEMHEIWSTAGDTERAFEQGYQYRQAEIRDEVNRVVVLVKEVDGKAQVDLGEYQSPCNDQADGVCIDDLDSVKVCVIKGDITECGVYGNSEAWNQEDIYLPAMR